jgi:hypothetical protein
VPENYPFPVITVRKSADLDFRLDYLKVLSAEQVAELGARYIWEALGENIDGKTVYLSFNLFPSNTKVYVVGTVMDNPPAADSIRDSFIQFTIDAVSGERIGIRDRRDNNTDLSGKPLTLDEYEALLSTTPANIGEYAQLVKEYAQKHFHLTDVISVVFNSTQIVVEQSGSGDSIRNTVIYKETLLSFTATDELGREAIVTVSMETRKLQNLTTQHNDFMPGFEHGDNLDINSAVVIPDRNG